MEYSVNMEGEKALENEIHNLVRGGITYLEAKL
jgi:hypothetical protein